MEAPAARARSTPLATGLLVFHTLVHLFFSHHLQGELLPVCLLSSIVRTAARDDEVDSLDNFQLGGGGGACDAGGATAGKHAPDGGADGDGDVMFFLNDDGDDNMADVGDDDSEVTDGSGASDSSSSDDSLYDDDEDDDESDTEDITDEGEMSLGSGDGGGVGGHHSPYGGGGGGGGTAGYPTHAGPQDQRMADSISSAGTAAAAVAGHASTSPALNIAVDRGRLLATAASAAAGFPRFGGGGGSGLTRCSSSNSFSVTAAAAAATGRCGSLSDSNDGRASATTRVSSAPTAGVGLQPLSSSCPRDTRWSVASMAERR